MTDKRFSHQLLVVMVAFVSSMARVEAQPVTAENISSFVAAPTKQLGIVTCSTATGVPVLGYVRVGDQTVSPIAGGFFSALSPSIDQRIVRLRSKYNGVARSVRRLKGAKAKGARRKLKSIADSISFLQRNERWCSSQSRPIDSQPGDGESPPDPGTIIPGNPQEGHPGNGTPDLDDPDWNFPGDGDGEEDEEYVKAATGPTHHRSGSIISGTLRGAGVSLVTLGNDAWLETVTARDGRFTFENVPPGTYFLRADAAGVSFGASHTVIRGEEGR